MQTLRKLPTMQPKVNRMTDQKWNGTFCQVSRSNMAGQGGAARAQPLGWRPASQPAEEGRRPAFIRHKCFCARLHASVLSADWLPSIAAMPGHLGGATCQGH